MVDFHDVRNYFKGTGYKLIIAADGEPCVSSIKKNKIVATTAAGGVAVALDPIARATEAVYIARAKKEEERVVLDKQDKMLVGNADGNYILKRLFFKESDLDAYYHGFSNQTLWPLCHVAFQKPLIFSEWYDGYQKVNQKFANAITSEIKLIRKNREKAFVWIHDYQLALVPELIRKNLAFRDKAAQDIILAMFWHIPWPTWEVFRILPSKKELLTSLLSCDLLAFHRGYQARNFLDTVERELEVRIDQETSKVYYNNHVTTVKSYPLGLDIDVVKGLVASEAEESPLAHAIRDVLGIAEEKEHPLDWYFKKYKVILSVDRLDYTKGISQRLAALDRFFEKHPKERGKVVYLGIVAPSRDKIPSYKAVKKEAKQWAESINKKFATKDWQPIHQIHLSFKREEVLNLYRKANLCMVTPLDDGMNLVSKEFVIAASQSSDPGMLVLSQFAGSATDLTSALIVNPYDIDALAMAIAGGLSMKKAERTDRIIQMAAQLEEKNVYDWALEFFREAFQAAK